MLNIQIRKAHVACAVLSLAIATLIIYWGSKGYWYATAGLSGQPAWKMLEEYPWLKSNIIGLIRIWSLPLGIGLFLSLYGASISMLELNAPRKYVVSCTYLYPIPMFFINLFVISLIPLAIGFVAVVAILTINMRGMKRKYRIYAKVAIVHNLVFVFIACIYLIHFLVVFED